MNASTDWYLAPAAAIDQAAIAEAEARQAVLTKPPGALGRLESLAKAVAGLVDASGKKLSNEELDAIEQAIATALPFCRARLGL